MSSSSSRPTAPPWAASSLFGFDTFAHHAEAGIGLAEDARGRGIGTAAMVQLVEFAFVRRNLRRVHVQAIASNAGAVRSYEKAGFVVEGRRREHAWVRGAYEDVVLMGILRADRVLRLTQPPRGGRRVRTTRCVRPLRPGPAATT